MKNVVDELGMIQAQIAELRKTEAELKAALIGSGEHKIEGALFNATVVEATRKITDWKKIAIKLGASVQMIRGNTKLSESISVRVTARATDSRKAA